MEEKKLDLSHRIAKVESSDSEVVITLENGVTMRINSNKGVLHAHFSGLSLAPDDRLIVAANAFYPNMPKLEFSNYFDMKYKSNKKP